jgi:hypothetical protein
MVLMSNFTWAAVTRNVNNTDGFVDAKARARLYEYTAQREQKFLTKVFNSAS